MVLKNQKQLKGSQLNNSNNMGVVGEDRISELPDPLLLHILSFLPTKCVVSTSILSKRWRYVWTSIPILDFREWRSCLSWDEKFKRSQTRRFMNFVDRMLYLNDDMPNIQKFYLCFDRLLSLGRVKEWISIVVQRKVEELILSIEYRRRSFMLPLGFFTCESLTMLEIQMGDYFKLPESISFPRLKILRLKDIRFVDEDLTQQFFSNCPVLEELILTKCIWVNMKVICISAPSLKRFVCNDPNGEGLVDYCVVKIYAPSLLSLSYMECVADDYVLCSFSSLVDANIDFMPDEDYSRTNKEIAYAATKLLENLYNVELLKMSRYTFEVISFADDLLTKLPIFNNLIHLEVTSSFPCLIIGTLLNFLQITPNLESLIFAESFYRYPIKDDDGWTLNVVPRCLLLSLKTIEFHGFDGFLRELNVVKLMLKNAGVLQRMTVVASSDLSANLKEKTEVLEKLLMFPKASTSCVVKFFGS